MRNTFLLLLFMLPLNGHGQSFNTRQDSIRTILIFSPDAHNENYNKQIIILGRDPLGLDSRNIVILEIFPSGGLEADGSMMEEDRAEELRKRYNIKKDEFRIIFRDFDGSVKVNQADVIDSKTLFSTVDPDGGK